MNSLSLRVLLGLSLALPVAGATAASGGVIHFRGAIVEPPCSTSATSNVAGNTGGVSVPFSCSRARAMDVSFNRVGTEPNPGLVTLTLNGKEIGSQEGKQYMMVLKGQADLQLLAKAGKQPAQGPMMMTISYR